MPEIVMGTTAMGVGIDGSPQETGRLDPYLRAARPGRRRVTGDPARATVRRARWSPVGARAAALPA